LDAVKKEFSGLPDFGVSLFFSLSSKKQKIILKRIPFFFFVNFNKNIKHFSKKLFSPLKIKNKKTKIQKSKKSKLSKNYLKKK